MGYHDDSAVAPASRPASSEFGKYGLRLSGNRWQEREMWIDHGPEAVILNSSVGSFRQESDTIEIRPQAAVNSISHINSVNQTFKARYILFIGVTITKREYDAFNRDSVNFRPESVPVIQPYNAVTVERLEPVLNPDRSEWFLYIQHGMWMAGHFEEHVVEFISPMSLRSFPFDVQFLELKFEVRDFQQSWCKARPKFEIIAEAYYGGASAGFQNIWVPPVGEWEIRHDWIYGETYSPNENSWGEIYQITVRIQRQYWYFLWRVVFVMLLISFSTVFLFAIPDEGDVLSYMSGLLVAAVAFLFSVSQFLPAVKYLTLMDKYILSSLVFILLCGALSIVSTVVSRYENGWVTEYTYLYFGAGAFLAWIAGHIFFVTRALGVLATTRHLRKGAVSHELTTKRKI